MSKALRVIFAGTPDFAAKHLAAILESHHQVVAVYSQPDRPAGRGKKLTASPVKQLALEHKLPVMQPVSLKDADAQQALAEFEADIMVVVAYGLLLPKVVLDTPRLGCINVHGSILPRWRGAAPIQRAIWAGDKQTGVTIMQMDEGLDTGPMLSTATLAIQATDTSATLYEKLAELGPTALVEALNNIHGLSPETQDDSQANYAKKLSKEEARIDWLLPAEQLERNVRAFNPWPMAFIPLEKGPMKVWQAQVQSHNQSNAQPGQILSASKEGLLIACGEDAGQGLLLQRLQLPGKKPMAVGDILNGKPDWLEEGKQLP